MATKKEARKFESKLVRTVILAGEAMHEAKCVTHQREYGDPKAPHRAGGQCSCCGAGPHIEDEHGWWLVFKAGLVDSDGVYYAMLCGGVDGSGCLESIRAENKRRKPTLRDEAADIISDLMGDDIDGAEAFMDDLEAMGEFLD